MFIMVSLFESGDYHMIETYADGIELKYKNKRVWNDGYGVSQTFDTPLDGFIVQLRKIRPLEGVQPRVMHDGIEAILVGKRGKKWVYVMPIGEGVLIEVNPNDGNVFEEKRDEFISFLKHSKIYSTVIDGDPVLINAQKDGAEIFIAHELTVYRNRLEWDEFNEKNFLRGAEKIIELPKIIKKASRITPLEKFVEVRINNRNYNIYYNGKVELMDNFVGEVDDFEEIVNVSYTTLESNDYPVFWSRDGELLTASGVIRAEKIDDTIEKIIDWSYRIFSKFMFYIDCTEKCHGDIPIDYFMEPIKIGNKLYYFDPRYQAWRSEGNIFVKRWKTIGYDGKHVYIGQETIIPEWLKKMIENAEDVSINEVIPGFPENGEIKPIWGKMFAMTEQKTMEFELEKVLSRVEAIVPYAEGLYKVWSSRDDPVDVWSPLSIEEIPEEHVIESIFYIGGFEGVTHMWYEWEWATKSHQVTYFFGEDRKITINKEFVQIKNGKKIIKLKPEAIEVISNLRNFDKIFTAAMLI